MDGGHSFTTAEIVYLLAIDGGARFPPSNNNKKKATLGGIIGMIFMIMHIYTLHYIYICHIHIFSLLPKLGIFSSDDLLHLWCSKTFQSSGLTI